MLELYFSVYVRVFCDAKDLSKSSSHWHGAKLRLDTKVTIADGILLYVPETYAL